ncbi:hypothetical protein CA984_12455 [Streptosporangium minutum]|uniref:Uncharacterized protein n=1 Tax=Streptosporangium minutum TaxID=569862 RepID=A0A243RQ48_9ACTN|nr:hypothetical protein CA984_12455 [Streptosporangium minutum]
MQGRGEQLGVAGAVVRSATGLARVLRDAMFPVLMNRFGSPEALAWLYDHRIDFDLLRGSDCAGPNGRPAGAIVQVPVSRRRETDLPFPPGIRSR